MNRTGAKVAALLAAALLMGATACGGDKKAESTERDAVTTTTEAQRTSDTADDSLSDLSDEIDDLDNLDALGVDGDCMQAASAYAAIGMNILTYMGGATPAQIAELQDEVDDLKPNIPAEIRSDFETYADGIADYAAAMQGVDMDNLLDSDVQDQLTEATEAIDSDEFNEAQANIDAYFNENCY